MAKSPYRIQPRKSYRFFKMNQDQREAFARVMERKHRIEELRQTTGEEDEHALQILVGCGLEPEFCDLLHLAPLVDVAWADNEIQPREKKLLQEIADARGISEGTRPREILDRWLRRRPADSIFEACEQVVHTMIESLPPDQRDRAIADLEQLIHTVATVSSGLFGMFGHISAEESAVITKLSALLHETSDEAR